LNVGGELALNHIKKIVIEHSKMRDSNYFLRDGLDLAKDEAMMIDKRPITDFYSDDGRVYVERMKWKRKKQEIIYESQETEDLEEFCIVRVRTSVGDDYKG
jgi:hypothetical protein